MSKYIFLNGKAPAVKEFKTDDEAIAEAKKDKSILRVQKDGVLKHIYEAVPAVAKAVALMLILGFLALALTFQAKAATVIGVGTGTVVVTQDTWTNSIAGSTAYTGNTVKVVPQTDRFISVQYTSKLNGAGTANQSVFLQKSVDNANWVSLGTLTVAGAGTTTVTGITNIEVDAIPYVRVSYITNAEASSAITNYSVKISTK